MRLEYQLSWMDTPIGQIGSAFPVGCTHVPPLPASAGAQVHARPPLPVVPLSQGAGPAKGSVLTCQSKHQYLLKPFRVLGIELVCEDAMMMGTDTVPVPWDFTIEWGVGWRDLGKSLSPFGPYFPGIYIKRWDQVNP